MMKVLSVRQPWLMHIFRDGKPLENRSWYSDYRGDVLLHAGKLFDSDCVEDGYAGANVCAGAGYFDAPIRPVSLFPLGAIIGYSRVLDCVQDCHSEWAFPGQYHHLLERKATKEFATPIPYRGQLGYFNAPEFEYDRETGLVFFNGTPLDFLEATS